jgi:putative MATE family efflux protein
LNLKNDKNYTYRNIWKIALPIIIGSAAQDLLLLADTAFIGRLGPVPLGAVAIGGLFYLAFVMAGWGFGIGIQVIIARVLARKNPAIERILQHSFLIMFLFAMLFLLSGLLTSKYLLPGFISSPDIAIQSQTFIDTRVWGFFAAMSNVVFRAYFVGTADTKIISISTLIMALTNCILDYFLIFGIWIFPQMGIKGSALASVIAEHLGTTVFLIYFLSKHPSKVFKHNMQFSPKSLKYFRVSTPMLFQSALSFINCFIFFVFVEKMGEIR